MRSGWNDKVEGNSDNKDDNKITARYAAQPALLVLAIESTKRPLIPKSQSLTWPLVSRRMFEGLTSLCITPCLSFKYDKASTV